MKNDVKKTGDAFPKESYQLRIRLPKDFARKLLKYPPVVRSEIVGTILNASTQRIDAEQLVGLRQELKNLALILNSTLRAAYGKNFDEAACRRAVELLERLVKR